MNRSWLSFRRTNKAEEATEPLAPKIVSSQGENFELLKVPENETSYAGTDRTGDAEESFSDDENDRKNTSFQQLAIDENTRRMKTVQVEVIEPDSSGNDKDRVFLEHTGVDGQIAFEGADLNETDLTSGLTLPPQLVTSTSNAFRLNETIDSCSTMSGSLDDHDHFEAGEDFAEEFEGHELELNEFLSVVETENPKDEKQLSRRRSFMPRVLSYRKDPSTKKIKPRRARTNTAKTASSLDDISVVAPEDLYSAAVSPVELTIDEIPDDTSSRLAEF